MAVTNSESAATQSGASLAGRFTLGRCSMASACMRIFKKATRRWFTSSTALMTVGSGSRTSRAIAAFSALSEVARKAAMS